MFEASPFEVKYTLGRVVEMIPYSIAGLYYRKIENIVSCKGYLAGSFASIILIIISKTFQLPTGFAYQGIALYFESVFLCICFIKIGTMICIKISSILNKVSSYTMGIYCMHIIIGQILYGVLSVEPLFVNLFIWISCIIISFILERISDRHANLFWIKWLVT